MGVATNKLLTKLAGENLGASSEFMPDTVPSEELMRLKGEYIQRFMFKHPKKNFHGRKAWAIEALMRTEMQGGRPVTLIYRKKLGRFVSRSFAMAEMNHCPDCGVQSVSGAKAINGTYDPDVKCDARCLNATGHNCDCSCGGKNHGMGWG